MKHEIYNYMLVAEAAERWGLPIETVKNKLKPAIVGNEFIQEMIDRGLIKYYSKPSSNTKTWIITTWAMEEWFHKKER